MQWSAEFHRIHAVDPLDFDGTFESYLELIHPEDRDRMRKAMTESVDSGRQFNGVYRVRPEGAKSRCSTPPAMAAWNDPETPSVPKLRGPTVDRTSMRTADRSGSSRKCLDLAASAGVMTDVSRST